MTEQTSALHQFVHQRFREVFGEPNNSLGHDDHWSLQPAPGLNSINVLVNGTTHAPAVWVFDPNDPNDGVMRTAVKDHVHLEEIIAKIHDRLKQAVLRRHNGHTS